MELRVYLFHVHGLVHNAQIKSAQSLLHKGIKHGIMCPELDNT